MIGFAGFGRRGLCAVVILFGCIASPTFNSRFTPFQSMIDLTPFPPAVGRRRRPGTPGASTCRSAATGRCSACGTRAGTPAAASPSPPPPPCPDTPPRRPAGWRRRPSPRTPGCRQPWPLPAARRRLPRKHIDRGSRRQGTAAAAADPIWTQEPGTHGTGGTAASRRRAGTATARGI